MPLRQGGASDFGVDKRQDDGFSSIRVDGDGCSGKQENRDVKSAVFVDARQLVEKPEVVSDRIEDCRIRTLPSLIRLDGPDELPMWMGGPSDLGAPCSR